VPAAEVPAPAKTVRRITADTREALTPREIRVAVGPRRAHRPEDRRPAVHQPAHVEYHLRKVFRRLDISSCKELHAALADTSDHPLMGSV
jgi:hypothetical protein